MLKLQHAVLKFFFFFCAFWINKRIWNVLEINSHRNVIFNSKPIYESPWIAWAQNKYPWYRICVNKSLGMMTTTKKPLFGRQWLLSVPSNVHLLFLVYLLLFSSCVYYHKKNYTKSIKNYKWYGKTIHPSTLNIYKTQWVRLCVSLKQGKMI